MNSNDLSSLVTLKTLSVLKILRDLKAFKSIPLETPKIIITKLRSIMEKMTIMPSKIFMLSLM